MPLPRPLSRALYRLTGVPEPADPRPVAGDLVRLIKTAERPAAPRAIPRSSVLITPFPRGHRP